MIVGIGIDQVEVERMRGLLARRPRRARRRLFSEHERRICEGRARTAECFAARFTAKEAFLKALGTGWSGGLGWREIEVVTRSGGEPVLQLSGTAERRAREAGVDALHVSCTHEAGVAAAVVILTRADG